MALILITPPTVEPVTLNEAKIAFCVAIKYGADELPVSGNVGELHVSPAEGTA